MPISSQAALSKTSYGKSRIRLVQVSRRGDRHELRDLTVAIAFEGEYDTSYTDGDNRDVLPTDTMKNTVYALAARDGAGEPEAFGTLLGRHFISRNPKLTRVVVDLVDHGWSHLADGPREHGQAFVRCGPDTRTAQVVTDHRGVSVTAGIADLIIMKTSRSAFAGYPRDEFSPPTGRIAVPTRSSRRSSAWSAPRCSMPSPATTASRFSTRSTRWARSCSTRSMPSRASRSKCRTGITCRST